MPRIIALGMSMFKWGAMLFYCKESRFARVKRADVLKADFFQHRKRLRHSMSHNHFIVRIRANRDDLPAQLAVSPDDG